MLTCWYERCAIIIKWKEKSSWESLEPFAIFLSFSLSIITCESTMLWNSILLKHLTPAASEWSCRGTFLWRGNIRENVSSIPKVNPIALELFRSTPSPRHWLCMRKKFDRIYSFVFFICKVISSRMSHLLLHHSSHRFFGFSHLLFFPQMHESRFICAGYEQVM